MSNVTVALNYPKPLFATQYSNAAGAAGPGGASSSSSSSIPTASTVSKHRSANRTMPRNGCATKQPDYPTESKTTSTDSYTLDQLVDRLLARPTSESDYRFQNNFLLLYRKFAAPSEVIPLILQKFEDLGNDPSTSHLLRLSTQLRWLTVLVHWVSEFPGDFAHPTTGMNLSAFANSISTKPEFAYGSRELLTQLENIKPDEDTNWAHSDSGRGRASTAASFSSVPSLRISLPSSLADMTLSPSQESIASSLVSFDCTTQTVGTPTSSIRYSASRNSESSSITSSFMEREFSHSASGPVLVSPYTIAQRHASMLLRQTRLPLTLDQWHEFMRFDDDVIAKELTRIDWTLFSAVRPRDLIRHINLSGDERANCKGLEHVDRMIAHFNHVASWLGEMILLRDKPKHRAQMMEKCMSVAIKLRQMNNYNGVGAFVAGIGNVAISRLQQTKELIDPAIGKKWWALDILMGMNKGYSSYRLAWNNTTAVKIPFLPLHRHDLVVAEESSPTFSDVERTMVNWYKFDTMGKSLWDIQKSQKMAYPGLQRNADVQSLIMGGRVGEDVDDMLYERSLQLEPAHRHDSGRRRSGWLRS